jgi:Fic family protein
MRLNLSCNENDSQILTDLALLDDYRYIARNLVPEGYEAYFQEQARYVNAHTSTAIEGNPLNGEAAMIVLLEGANPDEPAELEKVNLDEAYQFIAQLASDRTTKIDEGLIRALNSGTLRGLPEEKARNRGRYRLTQNLVVDEHTREIRYRPPAPELVPELMEHFIKDINEWRSRYPGPVAAALTHFGLISIHPFDDGNGRAARLIGDLVLALTDWSADGMLSANPILLDRREEYYEALRASQGSRFVPDLDVTDFVAFHTSMLSLAVMQLHKKVIRFVRRKDRLVADLDFLNSRQVLALMFMLDIGPLSTTNLARLTKTSPPTALSDLNQLVKRGAVVREGAGPNTRYNFHPNLEQEVDTE